MYKFLKSKFPSPVLEFQLGFFNILWKDKREVEKGKQMINEPF